MATASISFSTSGSAPNGYRVRYRKLGDTGSYTTVSPNPTTSPALINNISTVGIEGLIDADCGSGTYSAAQSFSAMNIAGSGDTVSDIYTGTSAYNYNNNKVKLNLFNWVSTNTIQVTFNVTSTYPNPSTGTRPAKWTLFVNSSQAAQQSFVGVMSFSGSWGTSLNNPGPKTYIITPNNYVSAAGATSSGTTITVGSTTGLSAGMSVKVTSGTGAFQEDTRITSVTNSTTFVVNKTPSTPLSGGSTVVRAIDTYEYFVEVAEAVSNNPTSCNWSLSLDTNYAAPNTSCSTAGSGTVYRALRICPTGSTTNYFTTTNISSSGARVQSGGGTYYVYTPTYNVTTIPYTITSTSSASNVITVCSTANLVQGMTVIKTAGTGTLQNGTVITAITSSTTFTVDLTPSVALSGATIVCQSPAPANTIGSVTVLTGLYGCP